jgi:hypothetical protein
MGTMPKRVKNKFWEEPLSQAWDLSSELKRDFQIKGHKTFSGKTNY